MESILQDVRYAIRMCLRAPAFTMVAVLALALGIGANTAIFTIVNAVLIERLPFHDPDRLVVVWEESARRPGRPNTISPANFLQWQERNDVFEQMASFYEWRANLTGQANPEEVAAQDVTSNFFAALGVTPLLGRTFTPDEGPQGHDRVVILSHGFWQRKFAGDPQAVWSGSAFPAALSQPGGSGCQRSWAETVRRYGASGWTTRPNGVSDVSSARRSARGRRSGRYQFSALESTRSPQRSSTER